MLSQAPGDQHVPNEWKQCLIFIGLRRVDKPVAHVQRLHNGFLSVGGKAAQESSVRPSPKATPQKHVAIVKALMILACHL